MNTKLIFIAPLLFLLCCCTNSTQQENKAASSTENITSTSKDVKRGFDSKYNEVYYYVKDGEEHKTSYYESLIQAKGLELSELSIKQVDNALRVYDNPENVDFKLKYISDFPSSFHDFSNKFHYTGSRELFEYGNIFIQLLGTLSNELPKDSVALLLKLSSEATWDADAPNYLQNITADFIVNNFDIFLAEFKKLNRDEQNNIAVFLADAVNFFYYEEYSNILSLFNEHKEAVFYEMFLKAKENRMKQEY